MNPFNISVNRQLCTNHVGNRIQVCFTNPYHPAATIQLTSSAIASAVCGLSSLLIFVLEEL